MYYGVTLDINDPFLEYNLCRLENRFYQRYLASIHRNSKRQKQSKPSHATTLQSIEENRQRFETVRLLQYFLLEKELDFDINRKSL